MPQKKSVYDQPCSSTHMKLFMVCYSTQRTIAETSNCICKSEGRASLHNSLEIDLSLAKRFKPKQWSQFIHPLFVLNLEVFKRNVYFLSTFVWPVVWNKKPGITKSIFVYQFTLSRQLFFLTFPFICLYSYLFSN